MTVAPATHAEPPVAKKPMLASPMPTVVGLSEGEATRLLRAANVTVKSVLEAAPQVGRVLSQDPAPGTPVEPGTIAVIHIGTAANVPTVMPRLVGRTIDEVRRRYEALYVFDIVARDDDAAVPGVVLAQSPAPGTSHPYRGRIRVELVLRPIVVPDVVGRHVNVAVAVLQRLGYVAQVVTDDEPHDAPGTVLSQRPPAQSTARPGATVRIVVAGTRRQHPPLAVDPAATVTCPALTGAAFHDAYHWLQVLGLIAQPRFLRTDDGPDLRVIVQDPIAGAAVVGGTRVALTVGRRMEPPKDLVVPLLLGRDRDPAVTILQGLGFRPRTARRPSLLPPGVVVEQLPPAGRPAAQGSDLILFVAAAPPEGAPAPKPVAMPLVKRRSMYDVAAFLYRHHCAVQFRTVPTAGTPVDVVVDQDPAVGTPLQPKQVVRLTVPERVRVPDVVGMPAPQARRQLESAGLLSAPPKARGTLHVVQQVPPAGAVVARGAAMDLVLAPPEPDPATAVLVPNLVGRTMAEARQVLTRLGLTLRPAGAAGRIQGHQPAAGQRVAPGSTVTARVAR